MPRFTGQTLHDLHTNFHANIHAPLVSAVFTLAECALNSVNRELRLIGRVKQDFERRSGQLSDVSQEKKHLQAAVRTLEYDAAQRNRDRTALSALYLQALRATWVPFLFESLVVANSDQHGENLQQRSYGEPFAHAAARLADEVDSRSEPPDRKDAAVKKLDQLIRADADVAVDADRFSPKTSSSTATDFITAIPRMVTAAFAAIPKASAEG